jgi:hypothetical protein
MKLLILTFSTNRYDARVAPLENSLKQFGYDYAVLSGPQFSWGGNNYIHIAEWLKQNRGDYTHILYTDAWDTLALAPPHHIKDIYLNIFEPLTANGDYWLFSGEKNCFPRGDWGAKYPYKGPWTFLNAGGYLAPIDLYIELVEKRKRRPSVNDQEWGTEIFLFDNPGKVLIDNDCKIFQTLYMSTPNELMITRTGNLYNCVTNTYPIFVHGNAKADMGWITAPEANYFVK